MNNLGQGKRAQHSSTVHRLACRSQSLLAAEREWQQWGRRSLPPRCRRKERDFVPIHGLLQHAAFGPEDIDRIVAAYEDTLRALGAERTQPTPETVAKTVMKIAQTGVRDPARIRRLALKELAPPPHNTAS
jgi:hypothetical protein